MARNRKNQSGAVRFIPALKATLLCMLIGGSAVGYVLQKNKLHELGRQINKREILLEHLKSENNRYAARLAKEQMPPRLIERVKELKLGLVPSQSTQWIWVTESPVQEPTNRAVNLVVVGE